jgi:dinuclear metal center YbgI/SA1388 family protein
MPNMKIKDITNHLESIAPLAYQESYDNCGLIVGDKENSVSKILLSLDCTERVVEEAIESGCELIIAHHPIIFAGLKKLNGANYVERTVIKAIKNNVAIYAIHTNLDNVSNGVNAMIAEKIGLKNITILQPKKKLLSKLVTFIPAEHFEKVANALFAVGAGDIGNYSEAGFSQIGTGTFKGNEKSNPAIGKQGVREKVNEMRFETIFPNHLTSNILKTLIQNHPYEEIAYDIIPLSNANQNIGSGVTGSLNESENALSFLKKLKETMATDCIKYTALHTEKFQKVAVCGGSGRFLLSDAIASGADLFITSDFKYHDYFDAEGQITIADIGHYESEQFTKDLLKRLLLEKFPTFAVLISKTNTNPVNYL